MRRTGPRLTAGNDVPSLLQNRGQLSRKRSDAVWTQRCDPGGGDGRHRRPFGGHRGEFHNRSIGQDNLERFHPLPHRTVPEKPAARGVATDHAAERTHGGVGRIGAECPATPREEGGELLADNARLHPHGVVPKLENPPHEPGAVDHQPTAKRTPAEARATAPWMNANPPLGGPPNSSSHVVCRPGPHNRQRLLLEQAAVGGVELPADIVAEHIAGNDSPEILFDPRLFLIHGVLPPRVRRSEPVSSRCGGRQSPAA